MKDKSITKYDANNVSEIFSIRNDSIEFNTNSMYNSFKLNPNIYFPDYYKSYNKLIDMYSFLKKEIPKQIKLEIKKIDIDVITEYNYKNAKIFIPNINGIESIKELKLLKLAIDKLSKEGFDKLLNTCKFSILPQKEFSIVHGNKNNNAYAFYRDNEIVMPFKENIDEIYFLNTIYHEFGHHVHLSLKNKEVYDNWLDIYNHLMKNKNLLPSTYSGTNEKELFAEIFGYVMFPNYEHNKIPMDLFQAFRNVIRGMTGISFRENKKYYNINRI